MPSGLPALGEDGPADVVRIPNAAACDRPDGPGGRQTRMNAPPETTEELNSFQRAGRAPPEDEFGRWHSTDRLPPGQDPVGGLEIGCRRNLGHEPHPLVPDVAQLREIVQPDRLRAPGHEVEALSVDIEATPGDGLPIRHVPQIPIYFRPDARFNAEHSQFGGVNNYVSKTTNVPIILREVRRRQRTFRADVIHFADNFGPATVVLRAISRKVPLTLSAPTYHRNRPLYDAMLLASFSSFAVIVPFSEAYRRRLLELGFPSGRIRRIGWGIDISRFSPPTDDKRAAARASLGLARGKFVVLWTGFTQQTNETDLQEAIRIATLTLERRPLEFIFCFKPEHFKPQFRNFERPCILVVNAPEVFRSACTAADVFLCPIQDPRSIAAPPLGWRAAIRLACDETFVEFKEGRGTRLRVQVLPDICPRRVAHGVSQVLVVREGRNLMGHLHRIPRQESGSSMLDQLAVRRDVRNDDGERRGHRLEQRVRHSFEFRGEDEDVAGGQIRGHLIPRHLAREGDSIPDIRIRREQRSIVLVTVVFLRVSADDHRVDPWHTPHHLHQPFQPLHRDHLPHGDEEGSALPNPNRTTGLGFRRQLVEPARVHAAEDDAGVVPPEPLGEGLRVHDERGA